MRLFKKIFFAVFFIFGLPFLGFSAAAATIPLATGDWAPYTGQDLEGHGFFSKIVTRIFKKMNYDTKLHFYPWARCEINTEQGKVFAAFPYTPTEERRKKFLFSDEIIQSKTLFYYIKNIKNNKISNFKTKFDTKTPYTIAELRELQPYKVGGIRGYFYEPHFKSAGINLEISNTESIAMKMLINGRVDITPFNIYVAGTMLQKEFKADASKIIVLPKPLSITSLSLMVSKSYPNSNALLKQFNKALKIVKTTHFYTDILKKFRP